MECRDRYLMIAANLSFTGEEPEFEVVGKPRLISRRKISIFVSFGLKTELFPR